MKSDHAFKKVFVVLFHLVLSLMLIDWAVKLPWSFQGIGIYEIAFALLGCVSLVLFCFERGAIFRKVWQVIRASKWSAIALAGYLIMGVITLFYAQTPSYALTKYIVIVQMLFFGVCAFYYVSTYKKGSKSALMTIYANIGLSAIFAAFWGLCEYFFFTKGVYPAFISPINDYNQYTTILLIGFVSIAFFIVKSSLPAGTKYLLAAIVCSVIIPSISVSGSRRSFVLQYPIVAFLLGFAVFYEIGRLVKNKATKRQFVFGVCGLLVCTLCVYATSVSLKSTIAYRAGKPYYEIVNPLTPTDPTPTDPNSTDPTPTDPTPTVPTHTEPLPTKPGSSAADRLNEDSSLGKRSLIWKAALYELKQYDISSLLFGRGASYSSDMYDNTANDYVVQVQESYKYSETCRPEKNWTNPHNLFLQDLLDGGIVLLLLQLSVILSCTVYTIKILRTDFTHGCVLGLMFCILLATLFLSCASGVTSNKFFWLIIMLQIIECFTLKAKTSKPL